MDSSSDSEYESIPVLLNRAQQLCGPQMFDCLLENGHVVNGAPTGAGKTVLTYWMLQKLREYHQENVELVIVGPSSLEANKSGSGPSSSPWTREAEKYKENYMFVTYDTIRGATPCTTTKVVYDIRGGANISGLDPIYSCMSDPDEFEWYEGTNISEKDLYGEEINESDPDPVQRSYTNYRGLVVRKDVMKSPSTRSPGRSKSGRQKPRFEATFSPSKWWMQFCVKNIILFIVEEAHYVKNDSVQNNAVAAMIRAVSRARAMRPDRASYVMYLTSTPMDKEAQAANYFKLIGLHNPIENGDMFVGSGARTPYDCFLASKIYNETRAIEIGLDNKIISLRSNKRYIESRIATTNPAKVTFQLWLECVLSKIQFVTVSMTPRQLWNGFFDIHDRADRRLFKEAHRELKKSRLFAEGGDSVEAMRMMSEAHLKTDKGMVGTIARNIIDGLKKHRERRFVVAFRLIESVDKCISLINKAGFGRSYVGRVAGLSEYNAPSEKKTISNNNAQAIYDFQNDTIKVIVGTFALLCTGLDLHDLKGNRPRWTYMSGNYDITVEQQLAGRTARFGSRSVPQIFICYPKEFGTDIQKIYTSNIQKSMVMTKTLESIRREGLSDRDIKFYKSIIRLPGAYDRYIELPEECQDMSYLLDYPIYDQNNDSYYPEEGTHGFLEYNDAEGILAYSDTSQMIQYLEEICHECEDISKIPGIVFSAVIPGSYDPYAAEKREEEKKENE